ncbi:hypothetical protein MNB_SV-6-40 [hydrothermal vent metagenome]|uniref:Uncharacterized protein n=1 Tax=hydrothermal vent metagenome TaxID=652676 RepID=A0A1W1BIC6_9ZZZZ
MIGITLLSPNEVPLVSESTLFLTRTIPSVNSDRFCLTQSYLLLLHQYNLTRGYP